MVLRVVPTERWWSPGLTLACVMMDQVRWNAHEGHTALHRHWRDRAHPHLPQGEERAALEAQLERVCQDALSREGVSVFVGVDVRRSAGLA